MEGRRRNALLERPLPEDAECLQPAGYSGGMPAISVAADEKLVPAPPARVPRHTAAEFFARSMRHDLAVLVGARCVAQRLMGQIATVPDQMTEERDTLIWPVVGGERLR